MGEPPLSGACQVSVTVAAGAVCVAVSGGRAGTAGSDASNFAYSPFPPDCRAIVASAVKELVWTAGLVGSAVTQLLMQPSGYLTRTRPCLSTVFVRKSS